MEHFDDYGNLKENVKFDRDSHGEEIFVGEYEAERLVKEGKVSANSDAARMYYARKYSNTTKGNYGIKTMYNRAYA